MAATVHFLHPPARTIAHYIRLGHTGHRMLETLHASGRFPIARAVVDPAYVDDQSEFLDALHSAGVELVLDTRADEMALGGRHQGSVKSLPWANRERAHEVSDFTPSFIGDLTKRVADFAVAQGMRTVLAPTRLVERPNDPWSAIDARTTEALRSALDAAGGTDIAIDYPLTLTYELFRNNAAVNVIRADLTHLPFSNLWLRISGFSSSQSAAGVRRYIEAAREFHSLAKPTVADYIGGLAGLSFVAFGAVGGLAHGVAAKERFDASNWKRPRLPSGGGATKRVYFPGLDTYLTQTEAELLFKGQGAKSLLGCTDPTCCPAGLKDMIHAPEAHFLRQREKQITRLNQVPGARRSDDFLREFARSAENTASIATQLTIENEELTRKLSKDAKRLRELNAVFRKLQETSHNQTRALPPQLHALQPKAASPSARKK